MSQSTRKSLRCPVSDAVIIGFALTSPLRNRQCWNVRNELKMKRGCIIFGGFFAVFRSTKNAASPRLAFDLRETRGNRPFDSLDPELSQIGIPSGYDLHSY